MTIVDLLLRLQKLGVTIGADGDRLKLAGPEAAFTTDLREELRARKPELIAFLREGSAPAAAIPVLPSHDGVPLSFTQQRFWFLQTLVPDTSAYHVCFGLRLQGRLDRAVLSRCLDEIVQRHELLRSTIAASGGEPLQTVGPAGAVPLAVIDLSSVPEADRAVRCLERARAVVSKPFDLAAQPPLRAALLALAPEDHALVVAMHHVASDAWSVTAFMRELGALYDAFASGAPSPLTPLPVQYADFASWQRDQLTRPALDAQREYWVRQLDNPPTLQLPSDRPRPAFQTFRGGHAELSLPQRLVDALEAIARRERGTLFMALLAGFAGLLQRYTGQTDLVVGTAIAGRSRPELEALIGPFINSLALRVDASGDPTFRTLVGRARETALGAYANQDLPFEKIVDELRLERALNRNPLFQVMLALQNVPPAPLGLRDLRLTPFEIDRSTTVSDLEIVLWPTARGLDGYVRYSADLFEQETVDRLLRHFARLLESGAADPDRRLSDLALLTDDEQRQLAGWNQTAAGGPRAVPVHESFAEQVLRTPDRPAVEWRGERLTYRELNARANAFANRILAAGVRPDDRVAVVLDRSSDFVAAALGVMKAGAAYLPIETSCPADRLAYMIHDAGARVVITTDVLAPQLQAGGAVVITSGEARSASVSRDEPRVVIDAANLAYVIYTSGSTGRPKGVALTHFGLQTLVAWHRRVYSVTEQDRAALVAGLGFDASVWEIWPYLLSGASICVPEDDTRSSAALLLDWLTDTAVSISFAPTPLAEAMFDVPMPPGLVLRRLLVGGDKLHRVPDGLPFKVYNNYGPTESTVVTSWIEVPGGTSTPPPIGFAVDNTRIHVLDARMTPVPVGVPGELFVAGDSLARGYLDRPDLTASRFVPDPFAADPGGRMYRTGDLVRRLADGAIEFLGRLDDQVKIRGFRIELGEIETVLARHPEVREAVVLAREGRAGNRRLIGYVTPQGAVVDAAAVTRFLKDRLPDYMVPSALVVLDAFPLTANGKVDRAGLPDPALPSDASREATQPLNDVERTLAGIWARVLRIDAVGPDDNFFEVGGDSILALQVVSAARQTGFLITPRQIFEQPTVAELAAVAGVPRRGTGDDVPEGDVGLTPIQRWFLDQDVPRPAHFNQAAMLTSRARLDSRRLEEALRTLVAHHDALRLRFERGVGGWRQYCGEARPRDVSVETIDLSTLAGEERDDAIRSEANRIQASLNLSTGPLVRAALFELGGAERQRLLLAIHHLVVDTVSWRILVADLEQVYEQLAAGQPPSLPEKTSSFKRWSSELAIHAGSSAVRAEADYWLEAAGSGGGLPVDLPGGANTAGSTDKVSFDLDAEETEALLRAAPKAYGLQAHEVLMAAVARSLSRWTGDRRVSLSVESHGRESLSDDLDLSRSVGWFTAVYPLSLDMSDGDGVADLLKRVKEQARGVPRLGIGYGALRYLQPNGHGARLAAAPSQPEVSFNYLGQFGGSDAGSGLFALAAEPSGDVIDPAMPRAHALEVSARIVDGLLRVTLIYSGNLHFTETIESFGRTVLDALRDLVAHCLAPEAGGYTPSDFPEANASQRDLDRLFASLGQGGRNRG